MKIPLFGFTKIYSHPTYIIISGSVIQPNNLSWFCQKWISRWLIFLIALNHCAASEEFLELIKSSLLAALEGWWPRPLDIGCVEFCVLVLDCQLKLVCFITALAPGSLFGLATFSHKIGLYDVQGPVPVVKNVFIPPDVEDTLPMELEDVMPLLSFLAPVCYWMLL